MLFCSRTFLPRLKLSQVELAIRASGEIWRVQQPRTTIKEWLMVTISRPDLPLQKPSLMTSLLKYLRRSHFLKEYTIMKSTSKMQTVPSLLTTLKMPRNQSSRSLKARSMLKTQPLWLMNLISDYLNRSPFQKYHMYQTSPVWPAQWQQNPKDSSAAKALRFWVKETLNQFLQSQKNSLRNFQERG